MTITKELRGLDELPLLPGRVRLAGGERPLLELTDPQLPEHLDTLVDPLSWGDPESPLRWTSRSTRELPAVLTAEGHSVSHETVAQVFRSMGYSLQATQKMEEGDELSGS